MKLEPKEDTAGIDSDGYDDIALLQQDGNDELCDLSKPPGLQPSEVPLPEDDDKNLLLCKLDVRIIRDAMAEGAIRKYAEVEPVKKTMQKQKLLLLA